MKTTHVKPVPMLAADLPFVDAKHIEMINCIHSLPCLDVKIKQSHYIWRWQYPLVKSISVDVCLQGEDAEYKLQLSKSDLMRDGNHSLGWNDYTADVTCIIFSAIHDELISIIEKVLDDQLAVTSVEPAMSVSDLLIDQNTSINLVRLGFSIWSDQSSCIVEGVLYMSVSQLEKLGRCSESSMRNINLATENLVTKVPLLIDSFSLTYKELESLSVSSVIRLQNSSLLTGKSHAVLDIGSQFISVDITNTRANANSNANNIICADEAKT